MPRSTISTSGRNRRQLVSSLQPVMIASLILLVCGPTAFRVPAVSPVTEAGLSVQQVATLSSLERVDSFPLYTMHYYGSTELGLSNSADCTVPATWGCSLFAALGGTDKVYGRNFDWVASPAMLLFTHPTNGYASISMVDLAYLGFGDDVDNLTHLELDERQALLRAPTLPFDGMNDRGLVVGMAAVADGDVQPDPNRETIDSLMAMRHILDRAGSVDEAVAILQEYNIDWGGGPTLHYLMADRLGRAALVEFCEGKVYVIPNEQSWHLATNFLLSSVVGSATGQCERYDNASHVLATTAGSINAGDAMRLLASVSQANTQWSIVYGMSTGTVSVTMGSDYNHPHTFHLNLAH